MINAKRPVRTTIFFGLLCGLAFMAMGLVFGHMMLLPFCFRATLFTALTIYSFILASWGNQKRIRVIFPLLFLLFFAVTSSSVAAFLLLCLAILSWIRSGICFQKAFTRSLFAEIIFSMGGGALVAFFNPYSTFTWALGIWMFFLVQSMYFIFMTDSGEENQSIRPDSFEQAKMRAEGILNQ